ncbi:MAG: hypothetical protein FWF56_02195 [Firmicutes bacterium]|nr:hypothetical protein [Bacillota bacterium]MCL1953894.1 hypothetical protein [Bacillota bacterium]
MLAVHFGIKDKGRGLVGQVLNNSGFDICFVDTDKSMIDEINKKQSYNIFFADDANTQIRIDGVAGININGSVLDLKKIIKDADLISTTLSIGTLKKIAPLLAQSINYRLQHTKIPLNIVVCEDNPKTASVLKDSILPHIERDLLPLVEQNIGFVNATLDRIIPEQNNEDMLSIKVEPYWEWVVQDSNIVGAKPELKGAIYVPELLPYIERKIFSIKTMGTALAYAGNYFGFTTVKQCIANKDIQELIKGLTNETGEYLVSKHKFDRAEHLKYQQSVVDRLSNPYIDTHIWRICNKPISHLGVNERFVKPALDIFEMQIEMDTSQLMNFELGVTPELLNNLSKQFGIDPNMVKDSDSLKEVLKQVMGQYSAVLAPMSLSRVIALVLLYRDSNCVEAEQLKEYIQTIGVEEFLQQYCGIQEDSMLMQFVVQEYSKLIRR